MLKGYLGRRGPPDGQEDGAGAGAARGAVGLGAGEAGLEPEPGQERGGRLPAAAVSLPPCQVMYNSPVETGEPGWWGRDSPLTQNTSWPPSIPGSVYQTLHWLLSVLYSPTSWELSLLVNMLLLKIRCLAQNENATTLWMYLIQTALSWLRPIYFVFATT